MSISELEDDDDEDWYDDDSDDPDDEWAPCPECGETVHVITGKCPACGYWLSAADRRAMWASESRPMWQKVTAVVLLVTFLAGILLMIW
jgi:ribosomal protein L37E